MRRLVRGRSPVARRPLAACLLLLLVASPGIAETPAQDDYVDRMAREHAGDRPVPSPMVLEGAGGGAGLETVSVEYAVIDGTPIKGYLARPAQGEIRAAVIVIHEWWGLNDNIRVMAERLAAEGWAALAVDLYEGEVADDPDGARRLMMVSLGDTDRGAENLRQARQWLTDELGVSRVASIGWCFGGGWSLQTALLLGDEIDATVIYYGRLVTDPTELAALTAPVLGHFGSEDQGIPISGVHQFEQALDELGKPSEVFIYQGAHHAFANPSGTRFDADAATEAWSRTTTFLHSHLDE